MKYERIDSFDINFVESAACKDLKLDGKGAGEKRLYLGSEEERFDEFFEFEHVEYCYILKKDLQQYLFDSKEEFLSPSQNYKNTNLADYYNKISEDIDSIKEDMLKFKFRKKFDDEKRYYLVLLSDSEFENNNLNYDYLREISLPRITKFCFLKIGNKDNGKKYIYLKPLYFNVLDDDEKINGTLIATKEDNDRRKEDKKARNGQVEYREKLFDKMPACIFTGVTEDRILQACHIKPYRSCDEEEKYDVKNGITMTPTYHMLFDRGFITFDEKCRLIVSPFLSNLNRNKLNLKDGTIYILQNGSEKYMKYHRDNIFEKATLQIDEDEFVDE